MDRKTISAFGLTVVLCLILAGCQSNGLNQSFSAQLPVDGMITFAN